VPASSELLIVSVKEEPAFLDNSNPYIVPLPEMVAISPDISVEPVIVPPKQTLVKPPTAAKHWREYCELTRQDE
jgi:hypothetical protein